MKYYFSKRSLEQLKGVDPRLQELMQNAIKVSPIDFGIPQFGGLRSAEEQQILFKKGVSKCDGFKLKSRHQSGKAIDIYAFVAGKASWKKHHLALVAGVIISEAERIELNIKWGGTFGSNEFEGWDMPHFELIES